ncbi:inositol polyphosphate kinase [Colletotrichum karsti]|uniref:Kinase n=1 Tax=Colletotrichum karsti TaxID=1095194 RepID=A0A9P6LH63_9PEZI|nr:inositol polyphosphate kinase [Colletotrichum karsti]KAF9872295.1 inositol polyphosphate kinase [Colletotrichum karsti]
MMGKKAIPIPSKADLVDYGHTVAGHAGTMCDESGELFIKPCTLAEVDFYSSANESHPDFAELMPLYMGTLQLNDSAELSSIEDGVAGPVATTAAKEELTQAVTGEPPADQEKGQWVQNKSKKIKTDQAVVLENSGAGFTKPNILDVKLGVRLWADDAPAEKKKRFDDITAKTTHGPLGFRIAGMKVYRGSTTKSELDEEDYKIYDKDYGRVHVNTDNIVENFRKFIFNKTAGIDEELGKAVAQAFLRNLRNVERVLSSEESRMYSASLLFVFEGDGDKLRDAIAQNNAVADKVEAAEGEKPGRTTSRVDSGIALIDEDPANADADEDDEDDGPALPKIFSLKLIDFAHAQWTPGQGPDENTLKGVRSLIDIFKKLVR